MRISDWSSDVCSSDLALFTLGSRIRRREVIFHLRTAAIWLFREQLVGIAIATSSYRTRCGRSFDARRGRSRKFDLADQEQSVDCTMVFNLLEPHAAFEIRLWLWNWGLSIRVFQISSQKA